MNTFLKTIALRAGLYRCYGVVGESTPVAGGAESSLLLIPKVSAQSAEVVATFLSTTRDYAQLTVAVPTVLLNIHSEQAVIQVISVSESVESALTLKIDPVSLRESAPAVAPPAKPSEPVPADATQLLIHRSGVGDANQLADLPLVSGKYKTAVEGFSLSLGSALATAGLRVEYKVLALNGTESAWTTHPQFCGTRGRHLPLVGMAARLVGEKAALYRCEYQLAFVSGQISPVGKSGMPLRSARPGDPIADIRIAVSPLAAPAKATGSKPAQSASPKVAQTQAAAAPVGKTAKPGQAAKPGKAGVSAAPPKRPAKKK